MYELPWNSVDGKIYKSINVKSRDKWVNMGAWIMSFGLIFLGILTKYKITIIFGVLFLLTLLMERHVVVTNRGLEIFYQMKITKSYDLWKWDDLEALTYEIDPKHRNAILFYFTKGDRTKKFYFPLDNKEGILSTAKKQNRNIKIYDGEKERKKMK